MRIRALTIVGIAFALLFAQGASARAESAPAVGHGVIVVSVPAPAGSNTRSDKCSNNACTFSASPLATPSTAPRAYVSATRPAHRPAGDESRLRLMLGRCDPPVPKAFI